MGLLNLLYQHTKAVDGFLLILQVGQEIARCGLTRLLELLLQILNFVFHFLYPIRELVRWGGQHLAQFRHSLPGLNKLLDRTESTHRLDSSCPGGHGRFRKNLEHGRFTRLFKVRSTTEFEAELPDADRTNNVAVFFTEEHQGIPFPCLF